MLADRRPEKIAPAQQTRWTGTLPEGLAGRPRWEAAAPSPPLEPQASHTGSCDPPVPPTHAHRLGAPPKPS